MDAINKAAIKSIPKRRPRTKQELPWSTIDLQEQRRAMKASYRRIHTAADGREHKRTEYNRIRNAFVKLLRTEKKKSWRKLAGEINEDHKGKCFRWIKKGSAEHHAPSVLKKADGEYTTTLKETLQLLLNTLIPSDPADLGLLQEPRKERMQHRPTTEIEVKKAIWRMSTRKAPGEDGIDAKILRKAWEAISNPITKLYGDLLEYGYFPRIWRTADVVTILKGKGKPREEPKSYRPVSLLPVIGKALEHLVCTRLNEEIAHNIADSQHSFRKERSTITVINEVRNWVGNRNEKHVMGVFLDISGAFDNVKWEPLIEDMTEMGASRATINITKSYLVNRRASITSNQTTRIGLRNIVANQILKND